jgi:hypothetical protein
MKSSSPAAPSPESRTWTSTGGQLCSAPSPAILMPASFAPTIADSTSTRGRRERRASRASPSSKANLRGGRRSRPVQVPAGGERPHRRPFDLRRRPRGHDGDLLCRRSQRPVLMLRRIRLSRRQLGRMPGRTTRAERQPLRGSADLRNPTRPGLAGWTDLQHGGDGPRPARRLTVRRRDCRAGAAFDRAVEEVAAAARLLIGSLVTTADPRDRAIESARARTRAAARFGARR